jgi:hypothetical protein
MNANSMHNPCNAHKGQDVPSDTKRVMMRCPVRHSRDGSDRCNAKVVVHVFDTGTDMLAIHSVETCRDGHVAGTAWDSDYQLGDLEMALNEGYYERLP